MPEVRETLWCNHCQRNTGHTRQGVNHILHFLITMFTCGAWVFVWILLGLTASSNSSHCVNCGTAYSRKIHRGTLDPPPTPPPLQDGPYVERGELNGTHGSSPAPRRSTLSFSTMALIGVLGVLVVGVLATALVNWNHRRDGARAPGEFTGGDPTSVSPRSGRSQATKDDLPPHRFSESSRPGQGRSQIRAVVPIGALTENEFRSLAVDLAEANPALGGAYLVQFFDSETCLRGWDGTGLLRNKDWPHWLCRITVNTRSSGRLYAATFKLALDETTGLERADVLRR